MSTQDGRIHLSFNGEIYNYLELREELARLGRTFVSGTDTEVLLAAYAEWGAGAFERLVGMFAFAIVDVDRRLLVLARDQFGIKPLYYALDRQRSCLRLRDPSAARAPRRGQAGQPAARLRLPPLRSDRPRQRDDVRVRPASGTGALPGASARLSAADRRIGSTGASSPSLSTGSRSTRRRSGCASSSSTAYVSTCAATSRSAPPSRAESTPRPTSRRCAG